MLKKKKKKKKKKGDGRRGYLLVVLFGMLWTPLVMTFCLVSRAIKRTLFAWCYQRINRHSQDTFDSNMSCHVIHFYFKPLTISIYLLLFITCILFCFFHFLLVSLLASTLYTTSLSIYLIITMMFCSKPSFYAISLDLFYNQS